MAGKRTYLRELNPQLVCPLCRGYLIDATTVVECLHSFCRSCILKHLRKDAQCPSCKILLNTAKPNIKADKALQDIVYKLVPGLYHKEMRKRREFYSKHPDHGFAPSLNHLGGADSATPEQRGEDVSGRLIFAPEDAISLSLEYLPAGADPLALLSTDTETSSSQKQKMNAGLANRRYLQCPALVTIAHLKKFLGLKYSVDMTRYNIDICHRRAPLPEHWTLMDVAYIFAWKRNAPIRFFYRITQEEQRLEAPVNVRPSTPGLGASQPATSERSNEQLNEQLSDKANEQTSEQASERASEQASERSSEQASEPASQPLAENKKKEHSEKKDREVKATKSKEREEATAQPAEPEAPAQKTSSSSGSSSEAKSSNDSSKQPEMLAKRTATPNPKESSRSSNLGAKSSEDAVLKHQVKSPIKIMKNSEGRYQVLRAPSVPAATPATTATAATPESQAAEFSVVSIGDGANSNGVKITLKQCQPSNAAAPSANSSSKKPKVISNVLLRNSNDSKKSLTSIVEQEQKQKRKVTFVDSAETHTSKKKTSEPDKKQQFLQGFRLAAAASAAAKEIATKESATKESTADKNVIKSNETTNQLEESPTKKSKMNSTNIADRLGDSKQLLEANSSPAISSSSNEQLVDVYAFPNDPPAAVPAGAVKRKCPPGLPIFEIRKKQQQQQQYQAAPTGKRTGVNTAKNSGATPVKCYRNQSAKPMVYAKPPASPARPLQSMPNPIGNAGNVGNTGNVNATSNQPVTSTSPKKPGGPSSVMISSDTRNLLDGCGLNIPASLSITLTAPKSPSRSNDTPLEFRGAKDNQGSLDKLSPSITLNDKSVDPRVLKALKAGQMRIPLGNAKSKGRQQQEQGPAAKRKKEEAQQQQQQQTKNILDLSGPKKMEIHPLRIPTPLGKYKAKPASWSQTKSPKPSGKEEPASYGGGSGQVVTLTGGQRFYRAPPGSLTPAAHRIGDIPTPTRAPVYAPCFSSPSASPRTGPANLSSAFPSLQCLYALSQAPSLEQFRMTAAAAAAAAAAGTGTGTGAGLGNSPGTNSMANGAQLVGKSHIAAQCAPVKPARSSLGSFAVPIAKQSLKASKSAASNGADGEMSSSSTDIGEFKTRKSDNSKEVSSKNECEQAENCASSTEESNSQQGAASPRVTSTASPSPPPETASSSSNSSEKLSSKLSDKRQSSCSLGSEVTSSNKSPESPDSSSLVTENLVDSPKPIVQDKESSLKNAETKSVTTDERQTQQQQPQPQAQPKQQLATNDVKSSSKDEEFKKPMTSEALQKRFLAAFPSNEWANNPVAAEQFGNFLKSLSTMQPEAQSKNTKALD